MVVTEHILLAFVAIAVCNNVRGTSLGSDTIKLCQSKKMIISPYAAADENGEWHTLIWKLFERQEIIGEVCENPNPGTSCSPLVTFAPSFKASCVQDYISLYMRVLDKEGKAARVQVKLPSSCSCKLTREE